MPNKRTWIGASLTAAALAASVGGCTGSQRPTAVTSAPAAASTAAARPVSTGGSCGTSRRVLADLQTLGGGITLDGTALSQLNGTLADLQQLTQAAPNAAMASLATTIRSALAGIAALARTDPQGAQASTRERARTLEQQYLSASQQLSAGITQACP